MSTRAVHFEEYSSVVVIGGGFAGMYAALGAAEKAAEVTILCKSRTGGSGNSVVAMSVHRFAPDAPGLRAEYRGRFLASGAGEQDAETAEYFVQNAAAAMERLRAYGFPLEYRTLSENGGEYPYLACCRPKQGRILTSAIRAHLDTIENIRIEDNVTAADILRDEDGRACGVLALRADGISFYPAGAVILACGGAGQIYDATSNTSDVTGDGYGMALRAGLPLRGMEFVQFYPYRIYSPRQADIFPDIFDHGAVYRNEKGERFMDSPAYPKKELENRDVVARAMSREKEVRLDLSECDMDYLERECPNIAAMYREDPSRPLLLRPVAHFFMGGVPLKTDGATDVPGLFACGEVTGGLHGANRLAGSALTEAVLFGRRAGESAAGYAAQVVNITFPFPALEAALAALPPEGEDDLRPLRDRLKRTMGQYVSVERSSAGLRKAKEELCAIGNELAALAPAKLSDYLALRNMLAAARAVTEAALERKESLGAHYMAE